jgi:hypothetical protein
MSIPIQIGPAAMGAFQSHFGSQPGSPDAAAECRKWASLCEELLAEREKLRAELAKAQALTEMYGNALLQQFAEDYEPTFTKEEALACLDVKPTIEEIIAELENAPRK